MKRIGTISVLALLASRALAHDFWIEPSTFRPAAGDRVTAALRVGQKLQGEAVPRIPQLLDRFELNGAPMIGRAGSDPAGIALVAAPGLQWIGYQSNAYPVTLDAAKFEEFLKQEGLERISAIRAQRHETAKPDRERFYRFAKSVLVTRLPVAGDRVADRATGNWQPVTRSFGYRFEIIPETNPCASTPLRVRLLFEGKPLANALVTAMHRDDASAKIRIRSDKSGRVTLNLPKNGVWMIKSVQMVAAPAGTDADWESLWASLTFER